MRDFTPFVWMLPILLLPFFVLMELIKIVFNISDADLEIPAVIFIIISVIYPLFV